MLTLEVFRDALRSLIGSDLPNCIDRGAYRNEFPSMWTHNPARAFLRLTDEDQRKVWRGITDNRKGRP